MATSFTITQQPDSANLYLYPNGSSATALTAVGETENYECVDDTWSAPNDNTDYVYTISASSVADIYSMPNHTTETGTINYVKVISRGKSEQLAQSSSATYLLVVGDASATSYSTNQAPITIGYDTYYYSFTSKPSDSQPWDWTAIDNLRIGVKCSSASVTGVRESTFRPNAVGDYTGGPVNGRFGIVGESNAWECVDDVTADEDTTYVYEGTGAYTGHRYDVYKVQDHTTESGTINNVEVFIRHRSVTYPNVARYSCVALAIDECFEFNGQSNPFPNGSPAYRIPADYTTVSWTWTSNPSSSIAWTWADIDNLQIGAAFYDNTQGKVSHRMTQCYAVVNYNATDFHPEIRTTQCYAVVNYTPAVNTVTLDMPESLSVNHSRQINRHTFPSGDYEVDDYGRAGKSLTISGVETSSTTSTMQDLKDMCHYSAPVTIAGLPDSNLNTDYHIVDYSFQQQGGEVDQYRWSLTMEED